MLDPKLIAEIGQALESPSASPIVDAIGLVLHDALADCNARTTELLPAHDMPPGEARAYFAGGERHIQEIIRELNQFRTGKWRDWPETQK